MAVKILAANITPVTTDNIHRACKDNTGRLWHVHSNGSTALDFYFSDDGGDTWSQATGSVTTGLASNPYPLLNTDSDGNLHLAYSNNENPATTSYRFGTVSGSTITWGSAFITNNLGGKNFDGNRRLVAFPYDTGWKVFIALQERASVNDPAVVQLNVASNGTVTFDASFILASTGGPAKGLDFRHTGDGLTPHGTDPHVYVMYQQGIDTTYYRKLSHSSGTWTMGTEVVINSTTFAGNALRFDGTRIIIVSRDSSANMRLQERDEANTTTTTRVSSDAGNGNIYDIMYNVSGDVYILTGDNTSADPKYKVWHRGTTTLDSSYTVIEETTATNQTVIWVVGWQGGSLDVTWADTSASPDDTWFENVTKFTSAPSWESPEDGVSERRELELVLDWNFLDPDVGATQSAYRLKRVIDAVTTEYWNGTSWQGSADSSTKIASTSSQHTLSKNWATPEDTQHVYNVKTWDDVDAASEYSDDLTIYPASIASSSRGLAFPKPWKRQEDILATLKANNDYLLAFNNNYVPTYGDANQDLTLRAGVRTANSSLMRDIFPPVIGSYSVGNGTSYFQDLGATNVYRTNELALSSKKTKDFKEKHELPDAIEFVNSVPVRTYAYKDRRRMGDAKQRWGLTAEDVIEAIFKLGITPKDSALVFNNGKDEDGELVWYLNTEQLVPVLWQAVQELSAEVLKLKEKDQK